MRRLSHVILIGTFFSCAGSYWVGSELVEGEEDGLGTTNVAPAGSSTNPCEHIGYDDAGVFTHNTWSNKLDATLLDGLLNDPVGSKYRGFISATLSDADLRSYATAYGFSLGSIVGDVATFRDADACAIQRLAKLGAVKRIEGSRALGPE